MKKRSLINIFILFLSTVIVFIFPLYSQANKNRNPQTNIISLEDSINIALEKIPSLKITKNNIAISRMNKKKAFSQLLPQVETNLSYDRLSYLTTQKQRFLGDSKNDFRASVYLNQPLFKGGKIRNDISIAKKNIEDSVIKNTIQRMTIAYEVKKAYYELCFAEEIMKNSAEAFQYVDRFYHKAYDLNRRTKFPRYETLLQIKVQREAALNDRKNSETKYKIAQKKLLSTLGLPLDRNISIKKMNNNFKPKKYDQSLEKNIENNPLIKTAYLQKALMQLKIENEKTKFWPQVSLRGGYTYEFSPLKGDHDWYIGLSATLPLGSIYETRTAIDILKKENKNADLQIKILQDRLLYEFNTAYLLYDNGLARLKAAKSNKESARKSLLTYYHRYNSGTISNSELLEAQRIYTKINNDYCGIVFEMRNASATLEFIEGIIYVNK